MTHTGYNQEDSVLANVDRGLFSATIYHTEHDEDNNIIVMNYSLYGSKKQGIKFEITIS